MRKSTTNKLNMYQTVAEVLSDSNGIWQGVPAFASAAASFNSKLDLLRARIAEQLSTTTGVSDEKRLKLDKLRKQITLMQSALMLHGRATENVPLEKRNAKSKTFLHGLSIAKLAARCTELKLDLETYGSELGVYGISDQAIADFIPSLITINEVNNSAHKAIVKRKNATQAIKELERAIDAIVRIEFDKLILLFETTQPDFFTHYQNARVISDLGSGHTPGAPVEPDDGDGSAA